MQEMNGVYAARKTNDGVKMVFIDEETIELGELNRRAAENREKKAEAASAEQNRLLKIQRKQQKQQACQEREKMKILRQELSLVGAAGVVVLGWCLGLVDLAFMVPVLLVLQAAICLRAGHWYGRRDRTSK